MVLKEGTCRQIWMLANYDPTISRRFEGAGKIFNEAYLGQRIKEHEVFLKTAEDLKESCPECYKEIELLIGARDELFKKNAETYRKWLDCK